jgi:hypothetical protein
MKYILISLGEELSGMNSEKRHGNMETWNVYDKSM